MGSTLKGFALLGLSSKRKEFAPKGSPFRANSFLLDQTPLQVKTKFDRAAYPESVSIPFNPCHAE